MSDKTAYLTVPAASGYERNTRLRRIKDTIHGPDCRLLRRYPSIPWLWAEERSDAAVQAGMAENGLRACRVCKPFENAASR